MKAERDSLGPANRSTLARTSLERVIEILTFMFSNDRKFSSTSAIIAMGATKKITVEVPADLLKKAQEASKAGITETVRTGLELLVVSHAYDRVRQMRGKVRFSVNWKELKDDR